MALVEKTVSTTSSRMTPSTVTRICCCGKSSRDACKVIAIVDTVIFSFFFLFLTAVTTILIVSPYTLEQMFPFEEDLKKFSKFEITAHTSKYRWYILGLLLCWCLGEIGFAFLLFNGAKKCSYRMLRGWIFLIIIDCLFGMVVFIPLIALTTHRLIYIGIALVYYTYRVFSLWTVHGLLREVLSQFPWV